MDEKSREAPPAPASSDAASHAETIAENPRRRAGSQKRKTAPAPAAVSLLPSKRLAKERNPYNLPPSIHSGPLTRARQSPSKLAAATGALQKTSALVGVYAAGVDGAVNGGSRTGDPIEVEDEEMVEAEPLVDADFEAVRSRGADTHVVPTHAGWFSWKKIHLLEKFALPSFFNGKSDSRTPEIYMEIRNSIMKKFHSDPQKQVELKDISELSVGGMDARQEVMEFLDQWGLINFHPFPPANVNQDILDAEAETKTSSLVDKLFKFEVIQPFPRSVLKKQDASLPAVLPNLIPEPAIVDDLVRLGGPSVEYHCNSCSADCSRKRYHCQKQADFDLCTECYNNGNFGLGMASTDFILMEPAEVAGASGGSWTDQETLLLLEALELFGENWNEIAEHVATKTKAQCLLHFLQMRIEDPFLDGDDELDKIEENVDQAEKESAKEQDPEAIETDTGSDKDRSASPPVIKVIDNAGDKDKPASPAVEMSKTKDAGKTEASCESGANTAIDLLKSAFQSVGYFPEQEGSCSFADAGNPVMALASFLACLVGPDDTISIRSSLKAISEDSPSIQLATRHCFFLEDPPTDKNDLPPSESAILEINCEAPKQEGQMSPQEESSEKKGCSNTNEEDAHSKEKDLSVTSQSQEGLQKEPINTKETLPLLIESAPTLSKEEDGTYLPPELVTPSALKDAGDSAPSRVLAPSDGRELRNCAQQGEEAPSSIKEVKDLKLAKEKPSSMKESGELGPAEVVHESSNMLKDANTSTSEEPLQRTKDADTLPVSATLEGKTTKEISVSGSTIENGEKGDTSKSQGCVQSSKDSDTTSISANPDEKATKQESASGSAEEDDKQVAPSACEKNSDLAERDDDHNFDRLKRAAVTALSAAAVKAKILAKEEEDQIRQLVSVLIEKQLYKLESKLSFFAEIESMIMRAREQLDRTRQRLMHERAQIIAARLGLPSNRANPQSLLTSKVAMNYANAGSKPSMAAFQKPPLVKRP